jgi:glycosyltransferase involved in cell wall biosynthesis
MTAGSVSVVIATRDRPELLRRAIDAVLAQEHPAPLEIVLVFDRSEPDLTLAERPK